MKSVSIIVALFLCLCFSSIVHSSSNSNSGGTATVKANFNNDGNKYGSCSCLQNYICTSSQNWDGVATFYDPIPAGVQATITSIQLAMTGDPFCYSGSSHLSLYPKLNYETDLSMFSASGSYNCYCDCQTLTNTTYFSNGLSTYKRNANNTIYTTVGSTTISCYDGYTVTISYTTSSEQSPTPSPTPSPSRNSGGSNTTYKCCVYNSETGNYDVTCTLGTSGCQQQQGYVLITSFPTNDCEVCFGDA